MIGRTIGQYEILEKLGEGGMGVVYKAHDARLDRPVALKFLPSASAGSSPERTRFVQEARAAASLNHPNVCSVIDIQEHAGETFIVMEYINGQTLRELAGGGTRGSTGSAHAGEPLQGTASRIPVKRAIDIVIQIAEGLAAAHERGIIHRDIKPENIMVRKDGIVQIMDFGLAKLRGISRLTREGSTVGTAGYMSPEQVQGQEADHRSDIFSVGVVLFELLTGELPFKGMHETAVNYEIVNVDPPPVSEVNPAVDPILDTIVMECLAKEPADRYQSAAELAKDLRRSRRESSRSRVSRVSVVGAPASGEPQVTVSTRAAVSESAGPRHSPTRFLWPGVAGLFLIAAAGVGYLYLRTLSRVEPMVEFTIGVDSRSVLQNSPPAVSPDGRMVVFAVRDSTSHTQLWMRSLASSTPRPLPGTEEATLPFWSPDSRFIGFFALGKLKKVEAAGGAPQTICDVGNARGGTWNAAGVIVFAPGVDTPLFQVSAAGGGVPVQATQFDTLRHDATHRFPWFLPDGRHFLYLSRVATGENPHIRLGSLDDRSYKVVCDARSNAQYAAPGYLLFMRDRTLVAQNFDPGSGECSGEPKAVAEDTGFMEGIGVGSFSISENGVLATAGSGTGDREIVTVDRTGRLLARSGVTGQVFDLALSPDERRVVYRRIDPATRNQDLWLLDLERSTQSRFTFDAAIDDDPVWSPDGSFIAFDTQPKGLSNLYTKPATGAGQPELLCRSEVSNYTLDWSRDGRYVAFLREAANGKSDLWLLPLTGERKPFPYLESEFDETDARFSPDGQWLAYASDENGNYEVYIQHVPRTGGKWQVSVNGGAAPSWRRDGKELYYLAPDRRLMAVEIRVNGDGIEAGIPSALFETSVDTYAAPNRYAAFRDGKRFLVNNSSDQGNTKPITVLLNWPGRLTQE